MSSRARCITILLFFVSAGAWGQTIRSMDFRGQNIADILMVLADVGGQSIIVDETVMGSATFHFSDSSFEDALYRFSGACNLFVEKRNNAYFVSRIRLRFERELVTINAEDVDIEMLVKAVSRAVGKTVLYDPLPRATISVNAENTSVQDLLEIIIKKYSEYSIVDENNAFYLKKTVDTAAAVTGRLGTSSITVSGDLYSMNIQRATFSAILSLLFKTAGKEYSLLHRIDSSLDNLYFADKTFENLLHLVLEQANCDYSYNADDGIYYIFEVQRRDILKKFKNVMVIQLQHIAVDAAIALLPNDYSGSAFIKADKATNIVYLTGSTEEITPIAEFFSLLDVLPEGKFYKRYEMQYLGVSEFISLLPQALVKANPLVIPGTNAFIVQITQEQGDAFDQYIAMVDKRNTGLPIRLRYIKSSELLQFLPPSATAEEVIVSVDPTLIFYKGSSEKQKQFLAHLELLDQPKPQIRYQLLVMQYQRSDNITWNKELTINSTVENPAQTFMGTFSNLFNINFDIITAFGYQFALHLNMQLGEDKAKVMADTTLNGLSGQDIKFENTTTFRYRDTTIDPETGRPFYTGVTREITSGLTLGINGWVSGDGMITMNVNAAVSKQDESGANASATTNPPPTSERVVNTQVRTSSGTPIVIGGLLQVEKVENITKVPLLGSIPLIGKLFQDINYQDSTTELVIYIVPHIHHGEAHVTGYAQKNAEYFKRYITGGK